MLDRFFKTLRRARLPIRIISVGNITLGGTGKTPLLIKLARDLQQKGLKPAVLSRGFKGVGKKIIEIIHVAGDPELDERWVSDEGLLMFHNLSKIPIGISPHRIQVARKIIKEFKVDVALLDDGFQHWAMNRDLDIVCVDATDPFGGEHLFPWGYLREPLSALRRAGLIVLTRTELLDPQETAYLKQRLQLMTPALIISSFFDPLLVSWKGEPVRMKEFLNGQNVMALSGIGNPAAFEACLEKIGARVKPHRFTDHYDYSLPDLESVIRRAEKEGAVIVMTEKDKVKLDRIAGGMATRDLERIFVLKQEMKFNSEDQKIWDDVIFYASGT